MNGVKKNKNQQQNGMSNKFGQGKATQQQDSMKKEYGSAEKSTKPSNGMMKKSSPTNGMSKGSNKYFSGSEQKSSASSKNNMSKTSYKKCDVCGDIEPTRTKRGR